MNINNVVLVRAMNFVPVSNILNPTSESFYLKKDNTNDFYNVLKMFVKRDLESKLGRYLDIWNEEDYEY